MITNHIGKFAWGVSHNESGIIIKLEDDSDYARILLEVNDAQKMIDALREHIKQFKAGEWYGIKMKKESK